MKQKLKEALPKIETDISVCSCIFKRKKNSKIERGIAIGEVEIIIDKNYQEVKAPVYSYTRLPYEGLLIVKC